MKALILAAGYGKRLRPITNSKPKAMVEINGVSLLENSLNCITSLGIEDIGIVVGHMASYIKESIGESWNGSRITYFENKRYLETNNIASFYSAFDFCNDDMLMLECDIFFQKRMLESLLRVEGDCVILVSSFNPSTMDGTVISVEGDRAKELILGKWQNEDFDYSGKVKTVNIYRFSKNFLLKYRALVKWYIENMGEGSYYEKVLGSMIYYRECDCRIVSVPEDMWCEIDNVTDLDRAKRLFKEYKVSGCDKNGN